MSVSNKYIVGVKNGAEQHADSSTPGADIDKVALHAIFEGVLNTFLQMFEPTRARLAVCDLYEDIYLITKRENIWKMVYRRHVHACVPKAAIELRRLSQRPIGADRIDGHVAVDGVHKRLSHQLEV